jgi:hypothetical protein
MVENRRPYLKYEVDDTQPGPHYLEAEEDILEDQIVKAKQEKHKKSNATLIVIGIIIAFLILLGVGLVYYFYIFKPANTPNNSNSNNSNNTSSGTTPLGGQCNTTADCGSGLMCSNNICANMPGASCSSVSDCAAGYVCASGSNTCLAGKGITCTSTSPNTCAPPLACSSNKVCEPITCTAVDVINNDDNGCTNGGMCNGQFCAGLLNQYCNQSSDCAYPYECSDSHTCERAPCVTSTVCDNIGSAGNCNNTGNGSYCSLNVSQPCRENEQCSAFCSVIGVEVVQQYQICNPSSKRCALIGNAYCGSASHTTSGCTGTDDSCCASLNCTYDGGYQCACSNNSECITGQTCDTLSGGCY